MAIGITNSVTNTAKLKLTYSGRASFWADVWTNRMDKIEMKPNQQVDIRNDSFQTRQSVTKL